MTKKNILKHARYFGAAIGKEFRHSENLDLILTKVNLSDDQEEVSITFKFVGSESGSGLTFELPKHKRYLNNLELICKPMEKFLKKLAS